MKKVDHLKSVYLVGIKGVAMSGLAKMAKEAGYLVTGSDVAETFPTDTVLSDSQIAVLEGFDGERLATLRPDLVVVSAAFDHKNPEIKAAKAAKIPIISQSRMLGRLMAPFEGIGVAGVHGKTTTTALLAYLLTKAGFSPSYAVGAGSVPGLDGNAHIGEGKFFVAEADEYRQSENSSSPKFLDLPLKHLIITSIELDHPDLYDSAEAMYQAFYRLATKIPRDGTILACADWPLVRRLVLRSADRPITTYGQHGAANFQIVELEEGEQTSFRLKTETEIWGPFVTKLPGRYNAANAAAALVTAHGLGVSIKALQSFLPDFQGAPRRWQMLGEINGAPVIDDYAHHPTAVRELIRSARARYPDKRLVVVFQPHTYSRTGRFLSEFAAALAAADRLILVNIYASLREKTGYVTTNDLLEAVLAIKPTAEYRSSLLEVATYLRSSVTSQDLILLVGAGDVYKIFYHLQPK